VVQIFAEAVFPSAGEEVVARRGDDPCVDRLVLGAPDAPQDPLLDDLEQLGLVAQREAAHLVEEYRAGACGVEESRPGAARARGRPLLEAEELRLEQGLRKRGAADLDERPLSPWPLRMDLPGDEGLAGSGLAENQDRERAIQAALPLDEPPNLLTEGYDLGTLTDQLAEGQGGHGGHLSVSRLSRSRNRRRK
jgi:hypothetical protein